jgi:Tfp pilus assembly protein PilN
VRIKQVNLLPGDGFKGSILGRLRYFGRHNRRMAGLLGASISVLLLSVIIPAFIAGGYRYRTAVLKEEIGSTKLKFKKLQSQDFQLEKMKAELKTEQSRLAAMLDILSSAMGLEGGYVPRLAALAAAVPKDLWLSSVVMDGKGIQLSGAALDSRLMVEFMDKLKTRAHFKEVRFVSSEKQVSDAHAVYNFQIAVDYEGKETGGVTAGKTAGSGK